jgi:hypothetical protein
MDHQAYKEVYFHEYCGSCKHKGLSDTETPCNECLTEAVNLNTHRPVKYEKQVKKETKR